MARKVTTQILFVKSGGGAGRVLFIDTFLSQHIGSAHSRHIGSAHSRHSVWFGLMEHKNEPKKWPGRKLMNEATC